MLSQWTETQNNRMENMSFHSKIICDRCGIMQPEGREGLGWFSRKARSRVAFNVDNDDEGKQTDICFNCIQSEEEAKGAARQLGQYIHHILWRNGSMIGRRIRAIEADQEALEKDCQKVRQLLEVLNPTNKQSHFDKIDRALVSARIVPGQCTQNLSARGFSNIKFNKIKDKGGF